MENPEPDSCLPARSKYKWQYCYRRFWFYFSLEQQLTQSPSQMFISMLSSTMFRFTTRTMPLPTVLMKEILFNTSLSISFPDLLLPELMVWPWTFRMTLKPQLDVFSLPSNSERLKLADHDRLYALNWKNIVNILNWKGFLSIVLFIVIWIWWIKSILSWLSIWLIFIMSEDLQILTKKLE